ncbi:hypothetical protein ACJMK2_044233 [Sinanodonta woodiana]|uniref:Uncharacterized protein n=1 Tax=Sinanodonta woodiana TaxID=1069815 RepID=A0ABD3VZC9_SINWO
MARTDSFSQSFSMPSPQYRIRCDGKRILIGDKEYSSASDALQAYIGAYEERGLLSKTGHLCLGASTADLFKPTSTAVSQESPSKLLSHPEGQRSRSAVKQTLLDFQSSPSRQMYKQTPSDLINPKSALHLTAERSLQTGVRDTDVELKLADTKDALNQSFEKMKKSVKFRAEVRKSHLQKTKKEVEDALNKSQELLDKIGQDGLNPVQTECPSDVGSLNTETLLSLNPVQGYKSSATGEKRSSNHVYSYRTARTRRAKTMSSIQLSHDLLGHNLESQVNTGVAESKTTPRVTFHDHGATVVRSNLDDSDDVSDLLTDTTGVRTSVRSPDKKARERSRSVSPSILKRERSLYDSGYRTRPFPSWMDSDTSSSKAPSWVDAMDVSSNNDSLWNHGNYTSSRPPPSWINDIDNSDITSVISTKPVKKLIFEDLLRPLPVITNTQDSFNSNSSASPPGLSFRDLVGNGQNVLLSPLKGKSISRSPARRKATVSNMLQELQAQTSALLSPMKGDDHFDGKNGPRCSSMDTDALINGISPPVKSDITGASSITAGDLARPHSPDTDVVLEGDRPWEKSTAPPFKQPVKIDNGNQNPPNDGALSLTGGAQPGSLEALKNMIFRLQKEVSEKDEDEAKTQYISEQVRRIREEAASLGIRVPASDDKVMDDLTPGDKVEGAREIPALQGYDFKGEPGGQSLEKALIHLSRLKSLVNSSQKLKDGTSGGPLDQAGQLPVRPLCSDVMGSDMPT